MSSSADKVINVGHYRALDPESRSQDESKSPAFKMEKFGVAETSPPIICAMSLSLTARPNSGILRCR